MFSFERWAAHRSTWRWVKGEVAQNTRDGLLKAVCKNGQGSSCCRRVDDAAACFGWSYHSAATFCVVLCCVRYLRHFRGIFSSRTLQGLLPAVAFFTGMAALAGGQLLLLWCCCWWW